jgi:hypothetical protein
MNIYLLNIPFAVAGVAIAVIPLIVGMKHQKHATPAHHERTVRDGQLSEESRKKEFQNAA